MNFLADDITSEIKPRYFVVHSDGSGEELLRYEDVCQYLQEAESNPSSAILHGGLEGDEEATTLTVLQPHRGKNIIRKMFACAKL